MLHDCLTISFSGSNNIFLLPSFDLQANPIILASLFYQHSILSTIFYISLFCPTT